MVSIQMILFHRLLFYITLERRCQHTESPPYNIKYMTDSLCGQILQEYEFIAASGDMLLFIDLFAEQMLLCGLTGHVFSFVKPKFVAAILNYIESSIVATDHTLGLGIAVMGLVAKMISLQ